MAEKVSEQLKAALDDALQAASAFGEGNQTAILMNATRAALPAVAAMEQRLEELEAALEAIDNYEASFHYPSDDERAEYLACPECTRRRGDKFFPSNYCEQHYRIMVMKYERLNDDERRYHTAHNMREIARAALSPEQAVKGERE